MGMTAEAWSALATGAATVVALGVAVREVFVRRNEQTERERAQAQLVLCRRNGHEIIFTNHSPYPVTDLVVERATAVTTNGETWTAKMHAVDDDQSVFWTPTHVLLLEGAGRQSAGLALHREDGSGQNLGSGHHNLEIVYQFTDTAGIRWRRYTAEPREIEKIAHVRLAAWSNS
jgi:hypothetical protein